MTAANIAAVLGGAHRSGTWWRCQCPVHASRGPTLALRDGERGLIVVCHAGCSRADILAELGRCGLIVGRSDGVRSAPAIRSRRPDGIAGRIAAARRIWETAQDARESPVAHYLVSRGMTIPMPLSLRWAPALRRPDGSCGPAMVARIDAIDGELIGVHRTWLDRDATGRWRRRDRAMLGRAAGGAVRLAPAAEMLMIGEGLETCLSALQATGMPAWAALNTSGLRALALPTIVREIMILADNDANGAGAAAAHNAARRWRTMRRGAGSRKAGR